jgi:phosphatidate cytidylyltransferase
MSEVSAPAEAAPPGAVIITTLFVYPPSFAILVGIAVAYASYEITRAIGTTGVRVALVPVLVGGAATLAAAWFRGPDGLVVGILLSACAVVVWRLGDGADTFLRDVGASFVVLLYLPALAGFAVLSVHADDGAARILAFAVTVVCSDTGGYATGVLFGRHPLAPIVSRGKTWEGFAGSVLFCSVAGVLFLTLTFHEAWWTGLLFGLAICLTATLGDLGESVIKRDLGVKDMGNLLPGHGGLMDRLDSMLPCAAIGYLLLSVFAP